MSGLLLASAIVGANYVPPGRNALVIAIMSLAFFGQGMTNLGWTVVSDVAPKRLIGLTSGIFTFSANLAGIVTPVVIGVAYQATRSFVGPLSTSASSRSWERCPTASCSATSTAWRWRSRNAKMSP